MSEPTPPPGAVLIRTSGVCALCDSRFEDELAWQTGGSAALGPALVEDRHFARVPGCGVGPTRVAASGRED